MNDTAQQSAFRRLFSDYGMVVVLFAVSGLFSALTLKAQSPTSPEAAVSLADRAAAIAGSDTTIVIVTTATKVDLAYSAAARLRLEEAGVSDVVEVNGSPADLRKTLDRLSNESRSVGAVIANAVTADWTVYDRYPDVGREKCLVARPYYWPDFLKLSNLIGVANQTAIYAIIAIGMTMVIICGHIDLSVGSLVALSAVVGALVVRSLGGEEASVVAVVAGCLTGIALCAVIGSLVGTLVAFQSIPSFIVTLSLMLMASGLAFRLSEGQSISQLPQSFFWLGAGRTGGVPNPVWIMIGLYVVAHVVMSRTVFGRYVYAIGGNQNAARLSGVPVRGMLLSVFTVCGGLAGLGGIMLGSQLAAGDPKFGLMYELEVIAAVVVGGTSLMGGQGKIFGTLIGAFIIAVIKNGMNLTNVDPFNQKIVLGAVLLASVWLDTLKRRKGW